jgi:cyclophilin family peptidyl-prolyl cis-trans isomerase
MSKIIVAALVAVVLGGAIAWYATMSGSELASAPQSPTSNLVANLYGTSSPPSGDTAGTPNSTATEQPPAANTQPQQTQTQTQPNKKIMQATLHTNKGDITFEFDPQLAPNAVANFIKLAQSGFYDGTKFHRVIKGFMNQGGDPLSKDDTAAARWGTGGPGYQFPDEITAGSKNNLGTVAMANSGANTNGSQFYINAANNNFLDGKYVVFAHVTKGMEVVAAINNVATAPGDRPIDPVVVTSVTVQ